MDKKLAAAVECYDALKAMEAHELARAASIGNDGHTANIKKLWEREWVRFEEQFGTSVAEVELLKQYIQMGWVVMERA